MGLSNPKILEHLTQMRNFDTTRYGLRYVWIDNQGYSDLKQLYSSVKTIKRRRKTWGLPSTRGAGWTVDNIGPFIEKVGMTYV